MECLRVENIFLFFLRRIKRHPQTNQIPVPLMRYRLNLLKRMLEDLLIFPFVAWGSWRASKEPLGDEYEIFFFFPFYHVGGAEKVHASLTRAFADKKAIIIFTRKSVDDGFLSLFQSSGHRILDISAHTDSKWKYWLNLVYRGRFSHYINQQKRARLVLQRLPEMFIPEQVLQHAP